MNTYIAPALGPLLVRSARQPSPYRLIAVLLLLGVIPGVGRAQAPGPIGKGCTTAYFIDKDCDGHGTAMRADGDYGPANQASAAVYLTQKTGDLPDADDNDPDVNTVASWHAKYGSGPDDTSVATLRSFLLASRRYNPTKIAFIAPATATPPGDDSTGCWWSAANPTCEPALHPFAHSMASGVVTGLTPGAALIFRQGEYSHMDGTISMFPDSATSTSSATPIIYMAYPGEWVILNGYSNTYGTTYTLAAASALWANPEKGWLIFDGLTFRRHASTVYEVIGNGLAFTAYTGMTFRNCEWSQWGDGVFLGDRMRDVLIEENVFHDTDSHAIYLGGSSAQGAVNADFDFDANEAAYWNPSDTSCATSDNWSIGARCKGYADRITIRNNLFYRAGGSGLEPVHLNTYARNISFSGNIVHNTGGTGIGLQTGIYDSTFENNLIFLNGVYGVTVNLYNAGCGLGNTVPLSNNCHRQASDSRRVKIRNNAFWMLCGGTSRGSAPGGFFYASGPGDTNPDGSDAHWVKDYVIENNVIVACGQTPFYFAEQSYPDTFIIRNNVVYNWAANRNPTTDVVMARAPKFPSCQPNCSLGNAEPGTGYTMAQFQAYNTAFTSNVWADPKVASTPPANSTAQDHPELFDFHLLAGSPAIGAAFAADAPVTDIFGMTRGSSPSIGPVEYVPQTCTVTTGSLPAATVGQVYSQTLAAVACGSSTWAGWSTCHGVSLDASTGRLSGTVSGSAGTCSATVTFDTASRGVTLTINAPPAITTTSIPAAVQGAGYTQSLAFTGGTGTPTCSLASGSLTGSGIALSGCNLTGMPSTPGTYTFTVIPTDANGITGSASSALRLVISAPTAPTSPGKLTAISGDGQITTAGQSLPKPFTVQAVDGGGKPVAGAAVTFAVTGGNGKLSATAVSTDKSGLASSTLTLGQTPGTNTVTASSATLSGSSVTFTATATSAVVSNADVIWNQPPTTSGWPAGAAWLTLPYDPVSGQAILYGNPVGASNPYSSDVFFYNSATNVWTHLGGTGGKGPSCTPDTPTQPGERYPMGQMAVDTKRNLLWIYGGINGACRDNPRRDTYYLTLKPNPLDDVWYQVTTPHFPAAASSASMVYDPDDDVLFAYGYDGSASNSNQWIYCRTAENQTPGKPTSAQRAAGCIKGDDWNEINHGATHPPAVSFVGLAYEPVSHKVLVYGGASATHSNQTWTYDVPTHTWTQKCQNGCVPPPVDADNIPFPALAYNSRTHKLLLHQSSGSGAPADWQYDPAADRWTKLASGGAAVTDNMVMAYDTAQDRLIGWQQGGSARVWVAQLSSAGTPGPAPIPVATTLAALGGDGQSGTVGQSLARPLSVMVTDAGGSGVSGTVVTFAVKSGGGTLSATSVTSDNSGIASTILTLGPTPGTNTVTATSASLAGSPITFTLTALAPAVGPQAAKLQVVSGDGQTGAVGATLPIRLTVRVTDAGGNAVAGAGVTFAVLNGGGTLSGTTAASDNSGLASTTLTLGQTPGTNMVAAMLGATTANSVTFTLNALAAHPSAANIVLVSGNGQTGTVGSTLPVPLMARVTDGSGNGVPGTVVTFLVKSGGGSLSATSAKTDNSGIATTTLTLGTVSGTNTVTAASGNLAGSPVVYTLTGLPGPAATLLLAGGSPQNGTAGQPLPAPLTVKAVDAYGNAVSGVAVTFTVTSGGGQLTARNVTTDAAGLASSSLTLGPGDGTQTATAAAQGLSGSPINFTAAAVPVVSVTWNRAQKTAAWPGGNGYLSFLYDPVSQQTVLFGILGGSTSGNSTDLFFYNSVTNGFTHVAGTGNTSTACPPDAPTVPGDRNIYGQMAVDTKRGFLWMYGGTCQGNYRQDMYYLTLNSNPATDVWNKVTPAHLPQSIAGAAMAYDADDDVLFATGDWVYCRTAENPVPGAPTAKQLAAGCSSPDDWNLVKVNGNNHPYLVFSGLVYDSVTKKIVQYGGSTPGGVKQNLTWAYDVPTKTWVQKALGTTRPPVTGDMYPAPAMAYDTRTNKVIYHLTAGPGAPADYQYDPVADTWTKLTSVGAGAVFPQALAYDFQNNLLIGWSQGSAAELWIGTLSGVSASPRAATAFETRTEEGKVP